METIQFANCEQVRCSLPFQKRKNATSRSRALREAFWHPLDAWKNSSKVIIKVFKKVVHGIALLTVVCEAEYLILIYPTFAKSIVRCVIRRYCVSGLCLFIGHFLLNVAVFKLFHQIHSSISLLQQILRLVLNCVGSRSPVVATMFSCVSLVSHSILVLDPHPVSIKWFFVAVEELAFDTVRSWGSFQLLWWDGVVRGRKIPAAS